MLNKKIIVLLIIFVGILSVSFVTAAENVTDDVCSADNDNQVVVEASVDEDFVSMDNSPIISEVNVSEVGTFEDLGTEINNVEEGGVLNLTKDYKYVNGSTKGISISKGITIDGNNHKLDGNVLSRIFVLQSDNIILKNIIFINGYIKGYGGGVQSNNENSIVNNCTFIDCYATQEGGGISGGFVYNCTFKNCSAKYQGGGAHGSNIYNSTFMNCKASSRGGGVTSSEVHNCTFITCKSGHVGGGVHYSNTYDSTFINCYATDSGGAITDTSICSNCYFENCNAGSSGGAFRWTDVYGCYIINCYSKDGGALYWGNVYNSTFVSCHATEGGAIYIDDDENSVFNSSFINCHATNGGAIYIYSNNNTVNNCSFENCYAKEGGAIFWEGSHGSLVNCTFRKCSASKGYIVKASADVIISKSKFENNGVNSIKNVVSGGKISDCTFTEQINSQGVVFMGDNENNEYAVVFPDDNATGAIEVFVNGVKTMVIDIVEGIAKIDLSQYKYGNYYVTFKYSGNGAYSSFTRNFQLRTVTVTAKNINAQYSAGKKFTVTVASEGKLLSEVDVIFKIKGKQVCKTKTNAKGVASYTINNIPGNYKITTTALGVSTTKTISVKHIITLKKVKIKKSAKKLVLTAKLAKVNKKILKKKIITFKFKGKKYTAKTNKKGVAKVTIKSKVLKKLKVGKKVTYQATYLKDTVKKSGKVKK